MCQSRGSQGRHGAVAPGLRASKALRRAGSVFAVPAKCQKTGGPVQRRQMARPAPGCHATSASPGPAGCRPVSRSPGCTSGSTSARRCCQLLCLGGWHAGLALHFFDRTLGNRRAGESPVVGQLQRQRVRAKAAGLKTGADPQPRVVNAQTEAHLPLARQRGTGQRLVQPHAARTAAPAQPRGAATPGPAPRWRRVHAARVLSIKIGSTAYTASASSY